MSTKALMRYKQYGGLVDLAPRVRSSILPFSKVVGTAEWTTPWISSPSLTARYHAALLPIALK
jgi:hypothetical protein